MSKNTVLEPAFCGAALKVGTYLKHRVSAPTKLQKSCFDSAHVPEIRLENYVLRIQRFGCLDGTTLVVALVYAEAVCAAEKICLSRKNVHRLFLACCVVASKWVQDVLYDNARMARVGGIHLTELNSLEVCVLKTLQWATAVRKKDIAVKQRDVDADWAKFRSGCRFAEDHHAALLHAHARARARAPHRTFP